MTTNRRVRLTNEQLRLCENSYDRTGIKRKNGCIHAKATQMVAVNYSHLKITPVAFCEKCASKVKKEASLYGYTVESQRIIPLRSI